MAVYVCEKRDFHAKPTCFGRSVPNVRCPHCRELTVNLIRRWPKWDVDAGKLFVKSGDKFMISDDLHVTLASMEHSLSLIQELRIEDTCILWHKSMDLGRGELWRRFGIFLSQICNLPTTLLW
ncbi:uncharacterized protein A4U43_C10F940 [Asparagus officinalis]|uniref:Uncharacterized protein n=1 Tax=Asparagus officinalis TaxID=4686 RepID=A0A5P1E1F5_ASPOF|nr:uncharacterized protein A4U43_C10F940 [Asparagus officinalis]